MESTIQTGSGVSTLLDKFAGSAELYIYFTLHRADSYLLSQQRNMKKNELTLRSLIKQAVQDVAGFIMEEVRTRERFYQWRDCVFRANHPGFLLVYWRKRQYLYHWETVMCWKLKSLIWQGVAVARAMDRLFNRPNRHSLQDTGPLVGLLLLIVNTVGNPVKILQRDT